ncbi:hypothetical protein PYCC9005_004969 [Savitreella phatthalungensis]
MRICCVECGDSGPLLRPDFGGYGEYITRLLKSSGPDINFEVDTIRAFDGADLPHTIEQYDGIVLSGSKSSAYDNDEWILRLLEWLRKVDGKVKIAGICFGHQIIARALGGKVEPNPLGWELAVTPTSTFNCPELLPSLKVLRLQQMHRDIVTVPPPGTTVLGASAKCSNQAMYKRQHFFSVQGHPEYNPQTVERLVGDRAKKGIIPEETAKEALTRTTDENDNEVVGQAIVRFFQDNAL